MKKIYSHKGVTVFQSALFQTNTTVVETSDLVLLVDPNWLPQEIEEIRLFTEGVLKGRPLYLLFTHSDYDHIIGYKAFSEQAESVIASAFFTENPGKEAVLEQIRQFDDEYYITRPYPIEYPTVSLDVSHDGQSLTINNTNLTFFLARGHNPDGIFTIVNNTIWIAGDYLSDVEFPYIYFNSFEYENVLKKVDSVLEDFNIKVMIPGHGNVATSKKDIIERQKIGFDYINALRKSVQENTFFDFNTYLQQQGYQFPRIMRRFHEANLNLIREDIFGH